MDSFARIGIWNVQWKSAASIPGKIMADTLLSFNPDVVCITEGNLNQMPSGWFACPSGADYGYQPIIHGRHKVILFSRNPWREIDSFGNSQLPSGRFVAATTETGLGLVRCVGVCIPWSAAHVDTGMRNRIMWEDHKIYLRGLRPIVESLPDDAIILGDFNQRVPRKFCSPDTAELLKSALGNRFQIVTGGQVPGVADLSIDHLACSASYVPGKLLGLSKVQGNVQLSDHFGLILELKRSPS